MKIELFSPSTVSPAHDTMTDSEHTHVKRREKGKTGDGGKLTLISVTDA